MKVRLIKKQSIENYIETNNQSLAGFESWFNIMKNADWINPLDIIKSFNSADILGNGTNRVVFNIGGNKYRMICEYFFGFKKVHLYVTWIGTHAEYTELCRQGRQYKINDY
ncbi:MAG: type II toxin-antitoxin system HigB family toxin [Cytophagales bacterium]